MKIKNFIIPLLFTCFMITSLVFLNAKSVSTINPETVNLTVQVNDALYDYPMVGAEVTVNGNNSYTGYTNKNGQAFFNGIPNDTYCVDGLYRNLKGHEDNLYFADSTYFVIIYVSQNDSLCP